MNTITDNSGNCPQCGQQPSKVLHPTCGDPNSEGCPWGLPKSQGKTFTVEERNPDGSKTLYSVTPLPYEHWMEQGQKEPTTLDEALSVIAAQDSQIRVLNMEIAGLKDELKRSI
jgi:hypothetical protein